MSKYLVQRIMWTIPLLLLLSLLTFTLIRQLAGDPCEFAGDRVLTPAARANCLRKYHLDWPFAWQFFAYVFGDKSAGAVCNILSPLPGCEAVRSTFHLNVYGGLITGDFGKSSFYDRPVIIIIKETFPISFQLGVLSIFVAVTVGLPTGVLAALKQNTLFDYGSSFVAVLGLAIPNMVLGPLLIQIFALKLDWFPIATWGARPPFILGIFPTLLGPDFWMHAALPTATLGTAFAASIARLTRSSLLEVIREDYIRTARSKGLAEKTIVVRHALKSGLIPVITVLGPLFAALITGTFVVEKIFGLPGMGEHFVKSILNRDYPIIMGVTLCYGAILILSNLLVDISYAWLDPRIRYD